MEESMKYVRDQFLAGRYGVCRQTIWRWVKDGSIPAPVKINGATRWDIRELDEFDKSHERWHAQDKE